MLYETLRLKVLKIRRKLFANIRRKKINKDDFTIISNNCWGGMVYESYNLPKMSPTVGLYFYSSDYIKFLTNLKEYIAKPLHFIDPNESKWYNYFKENIQTMNFPIGKIDDIEIFFLHYSSKKEAREKWVRRCKRINFEKMIVKFNDQNGCTIQDVEKFFSLPYNNKLFFSVKDWNIKNEYVKIKQPFNKKYVQASYEPFGKSKYIDINKYINNI